MGDPQPPGTPGDDLAMLGQRVAALESAVAALTTMMEELGRQVVTRRLAVVDSRGQERISADVTTDGTAQLVVRLPEGHSGEVIAYATPPGGAADPWDVAALGLQLRAEGDGLAELDAAPGPDRRWTATLWLDATG